MLSQNNFPVINAINSLSNNVFEWKNEFKAEIEFLGNMCFRMEKKIDMLLETNTTQDSMKLLKSENENNFPLQSAEHLDSFEKELDDSDKYKKYFDHFVERLRNISSPHSLYSRRRCLKEMLLAE